MRTVSKNTLLRQGANPFLPSTALHLPEERREIKVTRLTLLIGKGEIFRAGRNLRNDQKLTD